MARNALLAVLVLALGLGAWLVLRGSGAGPAEVVPANAPASAPSAEPDVERAPPARLDADTAPSRASVEAQPTSATRGATLVVRVLAQEDGAPLADVPVTVRPRPLASGDARTDPQGRVELDVVDGQALTVLVPHEAQRHGGAARQVEALAAGARAEVELRLPTRLDTEFHARLVDAQTDAPVASALVHRQGLGAPTPDAQRGHAGHERGPGVTPVDADGRFQLELATWDAVELCIHAPGWSLALVRPGRGHESVASEQVVRLVRAGALQVDVLDARGGALPDVQVEVTAKSSWLRQDDNAFATYGFADPAWQAVTGPDGRAELAGLPARAPLELVARRGREELRSTSVPALEPGETRALELRVGGNPRVLGDAVDADGAPLAEVEVWLVEGARSAYLSGRSSEPAQSARTDTNGRFVFDDVPAGAWSVGVAPQGPEVEAAERLSTVTTPIQVDTLDVDVHLVAHRGLTLEGTVVGPDDEPLADMAVTARSAAPRGLFDTRSDAEGRFRLAGFAPGELSLSAHDSSRDARFAPGEDLATRAGARDLVLRLTRAASIAGTLSRPSGESTGRATLLLCRSDGALPLEDLSIVPLFSERFARDGLAPGTYGIGVATDDGLVGVLGGIVLGAGEQREDLVVALEPGADLLVTDSLPRELAGCFLSAHLDGACVGWGGVAPGGTASFRVPGGHLQVLATNGGKIVRRVEVDVLAGETRTVVLE